MNEPTDMASREMIEMICGFESAGLTLRRLIPNESEFMPLEAALD